MKLSISHVLPSGIAPDAARAVQHLLLTPPAARTQTVLQWSIEGPGLRNAASFMDAYGNVAHLVNRAPGDPEEPIRVTGVVETRDMSGVIGWDENRPAHDLFLRATALTRSPVTVYGKFRSAADSGAPRIDILHELMLRIGESFDFDPEIGDAKGRDPEDKRANGPDFAHAFVGAARALGIPTRYVTGYYFGENDTPSFHCWGEALDLGLGWVGFDAARGLCPADRHVRLAIGLDAFSTLPVRASPSEDQPSSGRVKISVADDGAGSQQQSQ